MVDFPDVFARSGVSPNLEASVVSPFTRGADTGGSLSHSILKNQAKDTILTTSKTKATERLNATIQLRQLPWVCFGENEVLGHLFFFFSLSSRDVNSSSELADSSSIEGAERVRLGEASDAGVVCGGRETGEDMGGKGSDGELSSSLDSRALFLLAFDSGGLGFEIRVRQVLLTTILSSSSLSLIKTGESY